VRQPFLALLEEVADEFGEGKMFRPHRDTRFSSDKRPYKTAAAASIHRADGGGGYYLQLGRDRLFVGGGPYAPARRPPARARPARARPRADRRRPTRSEAGGVRAAPREVPGVAHAGGCAQDGAQGSSGRPPSHRAPPPGPLRGDAVGAAAEVAAHAGGQVSHRLDVARARSAARMARGPRRPQRALATLRRQRQRAATAAWSR